MDGHFESDAVYASRSVGQFLGGGSGDLNGNRTDMVIRDEVEPLVEVIAATAAKGGFEVALAEKAKPFDEERGVWLARSAALEVRTEEEAQAAVRMVQEVEGVVDRIQEAFGPAKKAAKAAHQRIVDLEKRMMERFQVVSEEIRSKVLVWRKEEERKRREEQEKAEAERRRQESERLKREEEVRKQRAEEAERLRLEAEKASWEAPVEEAEAIRAGGEEMAKRLVELPVKEEEVPSGSWQVVKAAPKLDGLTVRKQWKFRVVNIKLVPVEFLLPAQVDEQVLGAYARKHKEEAEVPGIEFYSEDIQGFKKR